MSKNHYRHQSTESKESIHDLSSRVVMYDSQQCHPSMIKQEIYLGWWLFSRQSCFACNVARTIFTLQWTGVDFHNVTVSSQVIVWNLRSSLGNTQDIKMYCMSIIGYWELERSRVKESRVFHSISFYLFFIHLFYFLGPRRLEVLFAGWAQWCLQRGGVAGHLSSSLFVLNCLKRLQSW